jgi:hypothetical protein
MGWEYDRAEDEYWSTRASSYDQSVRQAIKAEHAKSVGRAKNYGYTDEEIMGLDAWPWELSPNARAEQFRKVRLATLAGTDVAAAQAGIVAARKRAAAREISRAMKARTSPIGEPESLLARADREAKEAFGGSRTSEIKGQMQMINKSRTIANLKAAIDEAQKELALLERIPPEPGEKITTFTVVFPGSTKPYVYVGLRVDGAWKMSGKHFEGSDWTWSGIFNRFEEIHARVSYISTPTEFRHEQIHN